MSAVDDTRVMADVTRERARQDELWGEQNHRDGTGPDGTVMGVSFASLAEMMRAATNQAARNGTLAWVHIFGEEALEAIAESDPAKLRAELIQVAAVAVAWAAAIDRRSQP